MPELHVQVVFMHELAPAGHKTKGGSIVFLGVTAGIMSGLIVAMVVTAAMPQSEWESHSTERHNYSTHIDTVQPKQCSANDVSSSVLNGCLFVWRWLQVPCCTGAGEYPS